MKKRRSISKQPRQNSNSRMDASPSNHRNSIEVVDLDSDNYINNIPMK